MEKQIKTRKRLGDCLKLLSRLSDAIAEWQGDCDDCLSVIQMSEFETAIDEVLAGEVKQGDDGQDLKNLYWRMYQDAESTEFNSVVLTGEDMEAQARGHFIEDEGLPPVFEPVMMTKAEFDNLPEFEGY